MNLEKLPTDNLYKFIAISGLFFILIGGVYDYAYVYNIRKLTSDHINLSDKSVIEYKVLISKQSIYFQKLEFLKKQIIMEYNINPDTINHYINTARIKELKALYFEYLELKQELANINNEISLNINDDKFSYEESSLERDKLYRDSVFSSILKTIGGIIFILGLVYWYYKTQRILDKKLKNESNFEKLFEYRFLALKEINIIYYRIQPKRLWEDMDEFESYESVALNQSQINNLISNYLISHSSILDSDELKLIKKIEWISNDIKFEINHNEFTVSSKGIKLSKELLSNLQIVCEKMKVKFDNDYK